MAVTREQFWEITSNSRIEAEYMVDEKLKYLQTADVDTLRAIMHEYRFFIKYYINDLGILLGDDRAGAGANRRKYEKQSRAEGQTTKRRDDSRFVRERRQRQGRGQRLD